MIAHILLVNVILQHHHFSGLERTHQVHRTSVSLVLTWIKILLQISAKGFFFVLEMRKKAAQFLHVSFILGKKSILLVLISVKKCYQWSGLCLAQLQRVPGHRLILETGLYFLISSLYLFKPPCLFVWSHFPCKSLVSAFCFHCSLAWTITRAQFYRTWWSVLVVRLFLMLQYLLILFSFVYLCINFYWIERNLKFYCACKYKL